MPAVTRVATTRNSTTVTRILAINRRSLLKTAPHSEIWFERCSTQRHSQPSAFRSWPRRTSVLPDFLITYFSFLARLLRALVDRSRSSAGKRCSKVCIRRVTRSTTDQSAAGSHEGSSKEQRSFLFDENTEDGGGGLG